MAVWGPERMAVNAEDGPKRRVPIGPLMAPPLDPEEYVDEAARVARRLERLAFGDGVRASWVGLMSTARRGARWSIAPLGLALGDGMSGVALFLARLASVTGQPRHRLLAEQAAVSVLEAIDRRRERSRPAAVSLASETARASIGAFTGWGGVIYVLAHLGVLLESGDYVDRADALVPLVEELVDGDEMLDINAGSAGAIMGLAALHAVRPSDHILSVIRACASRLLIRAERLPIGYGWRPAAVSTHPPLIGFPEGAAGIALALLASSELTNDPAAHDVAHHAIEYERSAFVPATKNWPELLSESREDDPSVADVPSVVPVVSMTTWCRGAPGIGLGRLAGLRYLDYWRVRSEILDAVKATVRRVWRESLLVSRRSRESGVPGGGGGAVWGRAVAAGGGADCGGCDAGD